MALGGLNHVTLSVRDLERSFSFYRDLLGFRALARWRRGAYLLAGEETWLCLTLDGATRTEPLAEYTHLAFSIEQAAFGRFVDAVRAWGAPTWQPSTSEGDSLYFLDPDGHKLEAHVGDWRSRLAACRAAPYDDMVFF
ncbi:MAG: VOC family protein [Polyangiaceae bacterium]